MKESGMASQKIPPCEAALKHLNAALETGVRGANRDAIRQAILVLEDTKRGDLSDLHYRQLPTGGKLVDPDRPGLVMRHGKRTGKVWLYRFDHPETHKQTEFQFGRYPEMPTSEAREVWQRLRRQRLNGQRPSLSEGAGDAGVMTIEELVRRYLADYARNVKRPSSASGDERMLAKHLLPDYGKLLGLGKATVMRALEELEEKGFIAMTRRGHFYCRRASEYRLTGQPTDRNPATRDWENWTPDGSENSERGSDTDPSVVVMGPFQNRRVADGSV
jgi:hypothetical protein